MYKVVNTKDYLQLELAIHNVDDVIAICDMLDIEYEIVKECGLSPFLRRNVCRMIMLVSPLLVFCIISILSKHVWQINILDNIVYTDEEIIRFLNENDIHIGCKGQIINCEQLEKDLRANFEDIIWISVEKKGAMLNVYVKENEGDSVKHYSTSPSSIFSTTNGTIYSIMTRQGNALVHKGDTVNDGDMLVSGDIEIIDDSGNVIAYNYVNSDADISILYDYSYTEQLPIRYESREYIGDYTSSKDIIIDKLHIKIYDLSSLKHTFNEFKNKIFAKENTKTPVSDKTYYEISAFSYTNSLLSSLGIPHIINNNLQKEYKVISKKYTDQEGYTIINDKISKFFNKLSEKGIQIIEKNVKMYKDSEYIYAQISLKLLSNEAIIEKEQVFTDKNAN